MKKIVILGLMLAALGGAVQNASAGVSFSFGLPLPGFYGGGYSGGYYPHARPAYGPAYGYGYNYGYNNYCPPAVTYAAPVAPYYVAPPVISFGYGYGGYRYGHYGHYGNHGHYGHGGHGGHGHHW